MRKSVQARDMQRGVPVHVLGFDVRASLDQSVHTLYVAGGGRCVQGSVQIPVLQQANTREICTHVERARRRSTRNFCLLSRPRRRLWLSAPLLSRRGPGTPRNVVAGDPSCRKRLSHSRAAPSTRSSRGVRCTPRGEDMFSRLCSNV